MSERVTVVIGAGLPLNLTLPANLTVPSTGRITDEVCRPYVDYTKYKNGTCPTTNIVQQFRHILANHYPFRGASNAAVNFEQIFHCMEEYLSFKNSWGQNCPNMALCPVFGPFTLPAFDFDPWLINCVITQFLSRIMDIVDGYDRYFRAQVAGTEKWLADFFRGLPPMDVFNFNYDTMIETILGTGNYNDGFTTTPVSTVYKVFSPQLLLDNPQGLPTVNHLHGCINYEHVRDANPHVSDLRHEDWVKYPDYAAVKKIMNGSSQSQPYTQSGSTMYNGPIITGLNKTAKLNCIPFDIYHANLINSVTRNRKLLIIGYSFGDLYCNQIIQRMNLIHGDNARVCIIDYWNLIANDRYGFRQKSYELNRDLGLTLCKYSGQPDFETALTTLRPLDRHSMMSAPTGKLMLGVDGVKSAAAQASQIYKFLNS